MHDDTAAIEQRIAEMSDDEFDALVARTRPPRLTGHGVDWQASLAAKTAQLAALMNPEARR